MWTDQRVVVYTLLLCITASHCDFLSTPQSEILYEGRQTTLVCHVRAVAAFWQLNGTVYSELNSDYFESRGITSYDVILGPAHINKTLTVVGSPLNNNTIVNCIAFEQLNAASNTSGDAVITILGPPSSVAHREINSTTVELSWREEQYLPPAVTIQRYSIRVLNTSDPRSPQVLQTSTEEGAPDENGTFSRVFNFERELSPCTQITFSVTSTSSVGTSPPSNVTWERLIDVASALTDSLSCSILRDTKRLSASFKLPTLCAFQSGRYTVSLLDGGGGESVLLRNKTFFGYQQSLMVDQVRSQLLADSPVAIQVRITTDLFGEEDATKQCSVIGKPEVPSIGGLDPGSRSNSSPAVSGGFIAGVFVSSAIVLLATVLLVGVLMYMYLPVRTKQSTDSKQNLTTASNRS